MNNTEKDATLFWLHLKKVEGGVEIDHIKVPVEEIMELVGNVVPTEVNDGLDTKRCVGSSESPTT